MECLDRNLLGLVFEHLHQSDMIECTTVAKRWTLTAQHSIIQHFYSRVLVLELDNNELTHLPESFGKLVALECLHLTYNELTHLPDSFGGLVTLTRLELHTNQLTHLPDSFGGLVALTRLDLAHNQLTHLPDSFLDLWLLHSWICATTS